MTFIEDLVELSQTPSEKLPVSAVQKARLSLLDWMVCGWAGKDEPLAHKLRILAENEGGKGIASVFGGGKAPARMAALVNGSVSHALDYDDTHFAHIGHLSVGIFPAALAVAEETGASAKSMIEAFLVGAESAIRIGVALGAFHYNRGYHQTATAGAFGATVAAGRLYGLSAQEMRYALGLCATRASGLRSQFGTMGKPYNAGISASNGVECAQLAALGFTSAEDGLLGPQGFIATHTDEVGIESAWTPPPSEAFLFDDNKYKLHACCHGTHAMIEALRGAHLSKVKLQDVVAISVLTNPRWLTVCDKKTPGTGLEVKFSYAWLAGMTLRGDKTGDDRAYTDALAADVQLQEFAQRVTVEGDANVTDLQAQVTVTLKDGQSIKVNYDLNAPQSNILLKGRLTTKAVSAIGDKGQAIWDILGQLDTIDARDIAKMIVAE